MVVHSFCLDILDFFFEIFHIVFILWNLFALWFKKLRIYHFIGLNITLFSWIILGFWFGFGYCFLTDFHWQIKIQKGVKDLPVSFIDYLLRKMGLIFPSDTIDLAVVLITVALYFCSLFLLIRNSSFRVVDRSRKSNL